MKRDEGNGGKWEGEGRGWPGLRPVRGLMMDTISRLRCVQLKCGTNCVRGQLWTQFVEMQLLTVCVRACVWVVSITVDCPEEQQLIMILLRYTIYALYIYR